MALLVQKYGGSSVADVDRIRKVADRIARMHRQGHQLVVVVSAMGDTTDRLINMAREIDPDPDERELDMLLATGEQMSIALLAMALHAIGVDAVSMTGFQAGIVTDTVHTKAKIQGINPERVREALEEGKVVIVAGFQGMTPTADISTLGRGGSDTTAVALAAVLKADRCQICTDVDGVYTADPRLVPQARKIPEMAFDEMLELASLGAKVLQSRAVEFAKKYGVELEVLSSFEDVPGTIVKEEVKEMENVVVRGVAADTAQAKVTISGVPDRPGVAATVFGLLHGENVNVDMIVQNVSERGHTDISFTVTEEDLPRCKRVLGRIVEEVSARGFSVDQDVAKVSVVGVGMRSHSGVAYRMFKTLADNNINIEMISTSEIKISVVIRRKDAAAAARVLHTAFGLDAQPVGGSRS